MKFRKYIRCLLQRRLIGIVSIVIATTLSAASLAVEVIANPKVAVQNLPINTARSIFGMRQLAWPDGQQVRVFVFSDNHPLHNEFCKEMLNMYPYQLRQSWDRLIYSGTGQAPVEVNSEDEMLARVSSTPGSIGYVRKVYSNAVRQINIR